RPVDAHVPVVARSRPGAAAQRQVDTDAEQSEVHPGGDLGHDPGALQLVGRVDDGALARVVDQRVLDVERVRGHDALDQILFAGAVQRQAEAAGEDGAALLDEGAQRLVDVLLTGEAAVTGGREAPGGNAVDGAGAVEVDRRLEALPQRAG